MVSKYCVEGFDAFVKQLDEIKISSSAIYILFTGGINPNTGKSWCPDCVVAHPVIETSIENLPSTAAFITVSVGGRDFWKDKSNIFRQDSRTKLSSVPTLLKYGTPQRLEESQCANSDMINMLFEE